MKLLKGGAHLSISGVIDIRDGDSFLVQCPATGIVHILQKKRSSRRECYYITPQQSIRGQYIERHAIFQYHGYGNRCIHFNDAQIDFVIRSGNFKIEKV